MSDILSKAVGKTVASATSELKMFAMKFTDGTGLLVEAGGSGGAPSLEVKLVDAGELPSDTNAVCKVDWSWICKSNIKSASISNSAVNFQLDAAGPLQVAVQVWQGASFLAFTPWRAS